MRRFGDDDYTWTDWRADEFREPPPWRRGYRPLYFALFLALFLWLLASFWLVASRQFP